MSQTLMSAHCFRFSVCVENTYNTLWKRVKSKKEWKCMCIKSLTMCSLTLRFSEGVVELMSLLGLCILGLRLALDEGGLSRESTKQWDVGKNRRMHSLNCLTWGIGREVFHNLFKLKNII